MKKERKEEREEKQTREREREKQIKYKKKTEIRLFATDFGALSMKSVYIPSSNFSS